MKNYSFSKEIYSKISILKAAFAFTDRAYIHLDVTDDAYTVQISPKSGCEEVDLDEFTNEVLCQCLRHEVYLQTKTVRELLVARSLSTSLIEEKPLPAATDECDAVPEDILVDWFDKNDDTKTL